MIASVCKSRTTGLETPQTNVSDEEDKHWSKGRRKICTEFNAVRLCIGSIYVGHNVHRP